MQTQRIIKEVSGMLNIPPVGGQILLTLSSHRKGLFLKEIVRKTKRSERAIKHNLKKLHQFGFIRKKVVRTEKGKTAHIYHFQVRDFLKSARLVLLKRMKRLRELEG
ncbi:MAG: hypothetical protein QXX33_01970 [Candidatus Hadarchaeales archaeon]